MQSIKREPLGRQEPVMEAAARRSKGRSVLAFAVIFVAVLAFLAICNANGARVPLWGAPIVAAAVGLLGVLATSNA